MTRVARCGVRFESGQCRSGRGGNAVGRFRARASRAWTVFAGATESDDGGPKGDPPIASRREGVSTRVADQVPEPAPAQATQATPPRRRRGRPKGTRKVTNAPVPGDAMGVASLLWRLASDDEARNGTARIQPHGLEAVVPERKTRADQTPASATTAVAKEADAETARGDGDEDARVSGERRSASTGVSARDERDGVPVEERRRRASRSAGLARNESTRKKIAARQRERWAAARARATAKRTADISNALAQRREDAIVAAKRAALEGGAAAANAAARDCVQSPSASTPKSPWEALAANVGVAPKRATHPALDGGRDDSVTAVTAESIHSEASMRMATDAAERAAAFAALLSDASGRASDESSDKSPEGDAPAPPPGSLGGLRSVYQSFDASVDDDEDEELRATKRRMKAQLAKLTRRRAEMTGDTGAPSSVTVAKFTTELARYKRLRGDLEEWSDAFSEKHRRRPTVKDVERTGIAFLVENFKEYVELRDKLMRQTPRLRGQMEDVAKATLPTPRVVNKQSANSINGSMDASGAQSAARRIAAAREGKYGAGVSAALGMEPAGPGGLGPGATGGRGVSGRTSKSVAEGLRGAAGASVARSAALTGKSGSASAGADLAMKRAAAYREASGAADVARRGRRRGRGREKK